MRRFIVLGMLWLVLVAGAACDRVASVSPTVPQQSFTASPSSGVRSAGATKVGTPASAGPQSRSLPPAPAATQGLAVTPTESPTAVSYRHCTWIERVEVWLDANEDGVWDNGEVPFANAAVSAKYSNGSYSEPRPTDPLGQATLNTIGIVSCDPPRSSVIVSVAPPPGYRAMTATSVGVVHPDSRRFRFGVAPEPR